MKNNTITTRKALAAAKQNQSFSNATQSQGSKIAAASQAGGAVPNVPNSQLATTTPPPQQGTASPQQTHGGGSPPATVTPPSKRELPEQLDPWPSIVDMELVATEMADLIKKHCSLPDADIDAIVLWIIASYNIDLYRIYAKLALISPEKRCGKTTTMEVIAALCRDALIISNVSAAGIFRMTEHFKVTLLMDEADTFVKNGDPDMIGIINSGHTKSSAYVVRCSGEELTPKAFSTWMPMVLASIGDLPPTIMDRSISITLRRKKSTEQVQYLPVDLLHRSKPIRRKILRWIADREAAIQQQPVIPKSFGNDRAVDNWIPLFSTANQIGAHWISRCENAYRALTPIPEPELSTELLKDIREVLDSWKDPRISSQELVRQLIKDPDKIWCQYKNARCISPRQIAGVLAPYNIKPQSFRGPKGTFRGYERDQFNDAFERYLCLG